MDEKTDKDKKKIENRKNLAGAASGMNDITSELYGQAAKGHVVAYTGVDNESGMILKRSLKKISHYKVNPNDANRNLHQQAGFSAEVKEQALENEESILKGSSHRTYRTDDLGSVNDTQYDLKRVGADGRVIPGTGVQMKFVGKDAEACLDKLKSAEYQKYYDANAKIMVPKDYYQGVLEHADERIAKLQKQLDHANASGKVELAAKHRSEIEKLKKIKESVAPSKITSKEAMYARTDPVMSTVKDIHRLSHDAGIQGAKTAAAIAGAISGTQAFIDVLRGKKSVSEATGDVASDTAKSAATGYAGNYLTVASKSVLQNSSSQIIQSLGHSNLPGVVASTVLSSVNAIGSWLSGDISGMECLNKMGYNFGIISGTSLYAGLGQVLIPFPVVGALVGSMVGYIATGIMYDGLMKSWNELQRAREERRRVEAECERIKAAIRAYRAEMNQLWNQQFRNYKSNFERAFEEIGQALALGDIDPYLSGMNRIVETCGVEPEYKTKEEIYDAISDPNSIIKL